MEFFNFWNAETFHFFQWLTKTDAASPQALIDRAIEKVDDPEPEERSGLETMLGNGCIAVREALSGLLSELLEDALFLLNGKPMDVCTILDCEDRKGGLDINDLFEPLLKHAVANVDCDVVAEALLRRAGKWNPDRTLPEVL